MDKDIIKILINHLKNFGAHSAKELHDFLKSEKIYIHKKIINQTLYPLEKREELISYNPQVFKYSIVEKRITEEINNIIM